MTDKTESVDIDPQLKARLAAIASKSGRTFSELAQQVLSTHADHQERLITEAAEDEKRWQRYLETGQSISLDQMRGNLASLALKAAQKAAPQ